MNTPKTVPHTPTPWTLHRMRRNDKAQILYFNGPNQEPIQFDTGKWNKAENDARFVLRCVNSNDRLLSVVRQMVEMWDNDGDHGFPLYDEAKAALAASQPPPDHE